MQGAECDDVRWYFERSATQQMPHNSLQRFGTDVVAVKQSAQLELVDDCVDLVLGGLDVRSGGFDEQHAARVGHKVTVLVRGDAGVVDVRILVDFDFGHTGTLDDVLRVAVGGDDHAEGGVGLIPGEFGGFAVENGGDAGTEVGGELREHDFGFRVAEAGR